MNTLRNYLCVATAIGAIGFVAGCGDDEETPADAAVQQPDAAVETPDAAPTPDAADPAVRGEYLVNHISVCIDCHTPRNPDGSLDTDNLLSGADCFIDIDPATEGVGCLNTPNLSNHATGLMNRTDEQIKNMFLNGMRPNGDAMIPVMPYYQFHNMTDDDANAIVAYLRTIPGVDHQTLPNEPPFNTQPPQPATPVDMADVPEPDVGDPNYDSAMRGRYLASTVGPCLECHTPDLPPDPPPLRPIDMSVPFSGGKPFGLPSPPFPPVVESANLTSDATGLQGWTAQEIVDVLKLGVDNEGDGICPPMPAGPMQAFGGMTDQDALDIANYLLTLPAIQNEVTTMCTPPGP